jgi:hypothetical protein
MDYKGYKILNLYDFQMADFYGAEQKIFLKDVKENQYVLV